VHPATAPTSIGAPLVAPTASARIIFRRAQAEIDRIFATSLPFDVKIERCWDYVLQAGRDLDRLAAKRDRSDILTVRMAAPATRSLTMREALDQFLASIEGRR